MTEQNVREDAEDAAEIPVPRLGDVLFGKYRLVRKLGQGGMGTVFEAEHLQIGRRFAVKFLKGELGERSELRKRFQREARIAGSLVAENLVAVTDYGETDQQLPFIVMELLRGEDLRETLRRERSLSLDQAVDVVRQACRALVPAHDEGIVHRDLKPKNLFVTQHADGTDFIKVLDFGVARAPDTFGSGVSTRTGAIVGTFRYMPPEQIRGDTELDQRADVYSLGAILYELLAGAPLFTAEETHVLIHDILYGRPMALKAMRPGLPDSIYELVARATAKERKQRYADAGELLAALGESEPKALRESRHSIDTGHDETAPEAVTASTSRAPRRWVTFPRAAGVAALIAGLVSSLVWFRSRPPEKEPASEIPELIVPEARSLSPTSSTAEAPAKANTKTEAAEAPPPATPSEAKEPEPPTRVKRPAPSTAQKPARRSTAEKTPPARSRRSTPASRKKTPPSATPPKASASPGVTGFDDRNPYN